jgi:uncharacterized membrane protein
VTPYLVDIGTYALSLGLIAGYHVYLKWRVRLEPSYTIQSVNSDARAAWVENIMEEKNNSILAVQTLRNSTMAATFLASTAILLMMGTLNLMQNSHGQNSLLHALQSGIAAGDDLEQIKLLILLATFFWAFFSFSLALRLYNHVGYLINSSNDKCQFHPTPRYISRLLNRSGNYYSWGMRAYYISVPLVFALFNPYYIVIASVALVMVLYHIDRAPDTQPYTSDFDTRKQISESRVKFKVAASEDNRKISGF